MADITPQEQNRLNSIIRVMTIGQEFVYSLEKASGISDIFKNHIRHHSEAVLKHFEKSLDKIFALGDEDFKKALLAILDVDSVLMAELSSMTIFEKRELLEQLPDIRKTIKEKYLAEIKEK